MHAIVIFNGEISLNCVARSWNMRHEIYAARSFETKWQRYRYLIYDWYDIAHKWKFQHRRLNTRFRKLSIHGSMQDSKNAQSLYWKCWKRFYRPRIPERLSKKVASRCAHSTTCSIYNLNYVVAVTRAQKTLLEGK